MTKTWKLLLGLLTLWPPIYFVVFVVWFIRTAFVIAASAGGGPAEPPSGFSSLFLVHVITILLQLALLAVYITHVFRSGPREQDARIKWVVLMVILGPFAMPVYWWLYVWQSPTSAEETSQ